MMPFVQQFTRRRGVCCVVFPLLSLLLLGLLLVDSVDPAQSSRDLRLAGSHLPGDLPTLMAEHEAFFQHHGLNVEITRHDRGSDALGALKAGQADFALMPLTTLVLDRLSASGPQRPEDPVILASLLYSPLLHHLVVKADGPIRAPSDLAGQRVGMSDDSSVDYLWWLFAAFHGIDTSRVTLVDIPVGSQAEALLTGEVDALVTFETGDPYLGIPVEGTLEIMTSSLLQADNWVLVTRREMARQHHDISLRLLSAYRDAIDAIHVSPDEALGMYAFVMELDAPMRSLDLPQFGLNLDWSMLFEMEQMTQWAGNRRVLPHAPPDVLSWVEAEPLNALLPHQVSIPAIRKVNSFD